MVASGPRHRMLPIVSQLSVSTLQVSITVGRSEDNKRQTADGRGANKRPN